MTLLTSTNAGPLLKELSLAIPVGTRVLVTGPNQAAGVALYRATAGLAAAAGRIIRPGSAGIRFLAQRPYLPPPGTLRQILEDAARAGEVYDDRLHALLRELNLERIVTEAGGLDSEWDWKTLLSLREQQLLAFLHILLEAPRYVFLERSARSWAPMRSKRSFQLLGESSITSINIGAADERRDLCDATLECIEDGGWSWTTNSQPE